MVSKIWCRSLVICAVVALWTMPAMAQKGGQNPGSWEKFKANLERDDFNVREGSSIHFDPIGRYCEGGLPNALYANYGAPYAAGVVPPSPRETGNGNNGGLPVFRLAPDEAVVLVGLTPPRETYFSYQIYLAQRHFSGVPSPLLLNSLGDTVNIQTINTIGPDPFERPVVLIFTPDQETDARVRAALRRAGYPASIINTIVVPSATLNLGLEDDDDTFLIANRNALFADPDAEEGYVANPTFRVLRVTPEPEAVLYPFPTPPLRVRGTGQTEIDLTPTVAQLREAILYAYEMEGYAATEYLTAPIANEGFEYTQRHDDTLGDTRDALYLGAGWLPEYGLEDELTLGDDDFLIVYGLNHVATGKATYTNVNSYASKIAKLSLGSIYPVNLEGSAARFPTAADPAGDLTYAYKISRHCGEEELYCLELEVPDCATNLVELDADSLLGIAFRLYLEPATSIGAAIPEVVFDQVIKFSRAP
jgi:hypothetical protein